MSVAGLGIGFGCLGGQTDAMRLALLSDTHLTPAEPAFAVNLAAARRFVVDHGIAWTIHLGDITADGQRAPDQLDNAARQLVDWPTPLHTLFGNHDVGDNPGPHGHDIVTAERIAAARHRFGPGRFAIAIDGWLLIGLDAQLLGLGDQLEREQDRWLDETLPRATGPVGLFLHKPLFRDSAADRSTHHRYVPYEARDRLLARLASVDLRFVVSGHTHQSRRLHIDAVEHVWVPSTAFVLPDRAQERIGTKEVGMAMLTIDRDRHIIELVRPDGMATLQLTDHAHVYPEHEAALRAMADDACT